MKTFFWVGAAVLTLWALVRLLEPKLSYFPTRELFADPAAFGLRFDEVSVTAADGVRLHGWYCLPPAGRAHRADVVFFHGNGGNVSHRLQKIRELGRLGLGVFIVDYRGYGHSASSPDDAGVLRDAEASFQAARARAAAKGIPLGIYGESLGTIFAVRQAAAHSETAFLILEGSFPGKKSVAARVPLYWPFLPFLGGALEMGPQAARVACPVLVMHARNDEVIPFALGRAVHDRLTGSRLREWYEVPRGGHNDCTEADGGFFPRIGAFLEGALPRG